MCVGVGVCPLENAAPANETQRTFLRQLPEDLQVLRLSPGLQLMYYPLPDRPPHRPPRDPPHPPATSDSVCTFKSEREGSRGP